MNLTGRERELEKKAEKEIIQFAEEQPKVRAVYYGKIDERENYIFYTGPPYDWKFEDKVTDLDIEFAKKFPQIFLSFIVLSREYDCDKETWKCLYKR